MKFKSLLMASFQVYYLKNLIVFFHYCSFMQFLQNNDNSIGYKMYNPVRCIYNLKSDYKRNLPVDPSDF